ncbi:MAG: hypothetical protein GVY33_09865 [Alphaproteobacteria bacterium]|jgi:hypothetical protein|nr:hypothetical protein [Alphaproteobacteria bacterium]
MSAPAVHGRLAVAGLVVTVVAAMVIFDLATAPWIDPFQAPPPAALGSGLAASSAHCAVTPN